MNVKAANAAEEEVDQDLADQADPEEGADTEQEGDDGAEDETDGEGSEAAAGAEPEEVVVTIGDAEPEADQQEAEVAKAPEWVRELRKSHRETSKRLRELEAENARLKGGAQPAEPAALVLGEKPTLASVGYDEAELDKQLEAWHERRQQIEAQKRQREQQAEAERKAWEATVAKHNERKAALKVRDMDEAEAVVDELFSPTQQGILLHVAENSAVLKYALGRNPAKARELAQITDLPKFIAALARLETQVKTMAKPKQVPQPERVIRGSGALPGSSDKHLERLRAEADKTGDRSKVAAYLRQKQAA